MEETEDYEEVADEDIDEEEDIEEPTQKIKKVPSPPLQIQKRPKSRIPEVQAPKMPESRYFAYRAQAEEGVMDRETNIPIGNDIYMILAEILNKLNKIEISQS